MTTDFTKTGPREFRVYVLKSSKAPRREPEEYGALKKSLYRDGRVTLYVWLHDGKPIMYSLEVSREPTASVDGPISAAIFFRKHSKEYKRRKMSVMFRDEYVRLLRFGKSNFDYVFCCSKPRSNLRLGDRRFSTIANIHPMEKEVTRVNVTIPKKEPNDG